MKKYKWLIILINLFLLLGVFNYGLVKKETLLTNGKLILLELAPVDPRSLMQGDYMRLRYAIADDYDSISKRGFCVVKLDAQGIAKKMRFQDDRSPLNDNEYLIEYTSKGWGNVKIGAESFFFQEGDAYKYEQAKYGGIKVDQQGHSLLIGLYDEQQQEIQ